MAILQYPVQYKALFLFTALFQSIVHFAGAKVEQIYVSQNRNICPVSFCYSDIGKALESVTDQGAEVFIFPGEYILNQSITFTNTHDIRLLRYDPVNNDDTVDVNIICNETNNDAGQSAGLTFLHSSNIMISGLSFKGCGVLHNSTSSHRPAVNASDGYVRFYAGVYVAFCENINFINNTFSKSKGIAVQLYAVNGTNLISFNVFTDNPYPSTITKGGGLYIELPYCSPFDYTSCGTDNSIPGITVTNSHYIISNNTFERNIAIDDNFPGAVFIVPNKQFHDVFGRGGGLSLYSKGDSGYNNFLIESNNFTHNQAYFGAGMLIEFQDDSSYNNVTVSNNNFIDNNASKTGGGVKLSIFIINEGKVLKNTIKFISNTFTANRASWGGGMAIEITKERNTFQATNSILLSDCIWSSNIARLGSGLDITRSYSNVEDNGVLINIVLDRCLFLTNSVKYDDHGIYGYGALYANAVSITFSRSITFRGNFDGGALVSTDNTITFASNCVAIFNDNLGRDGPGITMLAFSYLIIEQNTLITFKGNNATNEGGAIFAFRAGGRNLLSSRDCFIRYIEPSVKPEDWKTIITFDSNYANGRLNAIFTTSVYPCVWGQDHGPDDNISKLASEAFCWNNSFVYEPNSTCDGQITTDAASFTLVKTNLSVIPGSTINLGITAHNDRNDNVTDFLVMTAHTKSKTGSMIGIDKKSKYISDDSVQLKRQMLSGHDKADNILILESDGPRVIKAEIEINFRLCPLGLINSTDEQMSCICPPRGGFHNYVLCDSNLRVAILKGYWIGDYKHEGNHKVGDCKYCSMNNALDNNHTSHHSSHITFESTNSTVIQQQLCGDYREGVLCGRCIDGYGPAINSYDYKCVKCLNSHTYIHVLVAFAYIGLRIVMPFSLFLVLFGLQFSVVSGYLNGPIFFAQVITTITLEHLADSNIVMNKIYNIIYGVWNLDFCISVFPTPCLHPKLNRGVYLLLLDYVIAFLPLLLVLFFKVLDWLKFFRHKPICLSFSRAFPRITAFFSRFTKQEVIQNGIVASIILSYNKVAVMTAYLLGPTRLYGADDTLSSNKHQYVLNFDGNIDFFSYEHRLFAVPVLICSSAFLLFIPFLLIIFRYDDPMRKGGFFNYIFQLFQKEFRPKIIEANNEELDISVTHSSMQNPMHRQHNNIRQKKIKHFTYSPEVKCLCHTYEDIIEGDYSYRLYPFYCSYRLRLYHGLIRLYTRWGFDEYRWVPGLYLLLRLAFICAYMFSDTLMVQLNIQIVLSIISAHFFLVFRPYIKHRYNIIDGTMFLLLAVILLSSVYQHYRSIASLRNIGLVVTEQYILLFLPFLWITGYIVYMIQKQGRLYTRMKQCCCRQIGVDLNNSETQPLIVRSAHVNN